MSPRKANILLLIAAAVWGMGFIAQDTVMVHIGPLAFVALRYMLAGLALIPFAFVEQMKRRRRGALLDPSPRQPSTRLRLWQILPIGLAFFAANATQQIGLLQTSVTNAGFLTALYVIFVPLITLFVLRRRQAPIIWPASALALFGIYLLSNGGLAVLNWGDWLTIASAGFWSAHVILVGRLAGQYGRPFTLAMAQFMICGLLGLIGHWIAVTADIGAGFSEVALDAPSLYAARTHILYSGLIAGGFAFTLQVVAQQKTSAAAAAILLSSESLFSAALGAALLGERLNLTGYAGCAMIFTAIVLIGLWPPPKSSSDQPCRGAA